MTNSLVSTEWLAAHLGDPNLIVLDASLYLPGAGYIARVEYDAGHIAGAGFLDLERLHDNENSHPYMVPSIDQFRRHIGALGIQLNHHIILYDNAPHVTAARAWFLFKHFGFEKVSILDGGLPKWRAEGRLLETLAHQYSAETLPMFTEQDSIVSKADVLHIIENRSPAESAVQIVDARSASRFNGEEDENRPGLASGHIPTSKNLPFDTLFSDNHLWKQGDALKQVFLDAGVSLNQPLIATCGSGITACVILFGAHLLGATDIKLYDGSWAEWGADPKTPKETGPSR